MPSIGTVIVDVAVRPQLVPTTVSWYVPGTAVLGTVIVAVVEFAVQPNRLGAPNVAVQPLGRPWMLRPTRSKKVGLRFTVTGTVTTPPASGTLGAVVAAPRLNVPRSPTRLTSSSGSWTLSGSVDVFQPRLPEVAERFADLGRASRAAGSPCRGRRRR